MRYSNIRNFKDLTQVGTRLEDDIRQGTLARLMGRGYQGPSSRSTPPSSKTEGTSSINALDTLVAATSGPKPKRTFEPLHMSYGEALKKLVKNDFLQLLGPTPDPPVDKRSPRWDATAYCDYHKGKGHSTEDCFKLKHAIQDLLDSGKLPKPTRPSNKANPLSNHAIFVGSIPIIDNSRLITAIKGKEPIQTIDCSYLAKPEETEINAIYSAREGNSFDTPTTSLEAKVDQAIDLLVTLQIELAQMNERLEYESRRNARQFQAMEERLIDARKCPIHTAQHNGNVLPSTSVLNDIPIFKNTDSPMAHVKAFTNLMVFKGIKHPHWVALFPYSLDAIPRE
ncbi:hypothetical protein RND81_08G137100 [Saponaria officinalis]|uniref:Uncharacterized protein n=1 Tax=Saponaria officinalis TaxID=3572 RepID=A0AAW1J6X6_SAPOF